MEYLKLTDENQYQFCDKEEAGFVLIPIKEYNGLQNALRIVKDRALQQIDRAKADENGYTLIDAFKDKSGFWVITRQTPYSLHIPLEVASSLIKDDFKKHYSFLDVERKDAETLSYQFKNLADFLRVPNYANTDTGKKVIGFVKPRNGRFSFGVKSIKGNLGKGVYMVTYQATALI